MSNNPPPTCSDAPSVIAGHEAPTPEDFDYESPTQQEPCSSKHADDLTTAEEASDLVQAIEASNADEIRRQEYESLKAREEEWKRRGIAWNMNQARLNRRPGPLGATGKGARVKKQPERFGAAIPSETISPPKRRPQTGSKMPKFTLQATPKPETKTRRLPKDRKTKHVRAATPSPAKATEGTSASNERPDQADQELARLASHYTSQLDHMTIEEIRQQAGVETSGENLESSPEK